MNAKEVLYQEDKVKRFEDSCFKFVEHKEEEFCEEEVIAFAEYYANQRVIEELEKYRDRWKSQMDAIPTMVDVRQGKAENVSDIKRYQMEGLAQAWYELRQRVNELKLK